MRRSEPECGAPPRLRTARFTATSLLVCAVSCGGSEPSPGHGPPSAPLRPPSASALASASDASAPPEVPGTPGRTPTLVALAPPETVTLAPELWPVASRKAAWLVVDDALGGHSFVRGIDASHELGPLRVLAARHPVAFLDGAHPLVVSSRQRELCFERLDLPSVPTCHRLRADVAVVVNGTPWLLEERAVPEAEEADGQPASAKAPKPAPGSPPPQKPLVKRLVVHTFDAEGKRATEVDSGLELSLPLPGMGLVGAAPQAAGLRVVHYEHDAPTRDKNRWVPQAKLMSVLLDKNGKVRVGTSRVVFKGERGYGNIEGHHAPELFGDRVLVGRFVDRAATPVKSGFEAYRLGPVRPVPAPNAVFEVDPFRLGDPSVVGAAELAAFTAIAAAAPRLSAGQPASEAGRVAWVGERGFFLKNGALHSAARADGSVRAEPAPFVSQRSRVHWATLRPDGVGLAHVGDALLEIAADGTTRAQPSPHAHLLSTPAQIGASFWAVVPDGGPGSGARVVRLSGGEGEAPALSALAHAGLHALVGGPSGLFVAVHGGALVIHRLAEDGVTTALGTHPSPLGSLGTAVAANDGGALLIGRTPVGREPIAIALDAQGNPSPPRALPLSDPGPLEAVELPAGALVLDAGRRHVVWLDATATPVARARWPRGGPSVACVDGVPARELTPGPTPGQLDRIGKLAGVHCWSTLPVTLADGSHRWLGTAVDGLDSRAVMATLPTAGSERAPPLPLAAKAPPKAQPADARRRCPPDMVSVTGKAAGKTGPKPFCIDRFETQLVDAGTGALLSPDYPSTPLILTSIFNVYAVGRRKMGDLAAQALPLPPLLRPATSQPAPLSRSRSDVRPSGYMTWFVARDACTAAGKRLCSQAEWVTACRGERDRPFPYGDDFAHGQCNVWRFQHPAAALHGNASIGHLDPRLNRVFEGDEPLLRTTGATPSCASRWGDDAVFDMVGNLDEWVEHKSGAFMGGFYSRTTKKGCEAIISAHPKRYLDYSLGTRCCRAQTP